ncbi:thioredoxin domain-containing protein [Schumannella soli]|uniref:thioredoxin domain-containing protein n=1 Tax=Schumannella soli TaxID=2590779 RepID=UPI0021085E59|nr:thioredoxin domain-containing protein [Schumannella soli]
MPRHRNLRRTAAFSIPYRLWFDTQLVLKALAIKYESRVQVITVEATSNPITSERIAGSIFPTFQLWKDGHPTTTYVGPHAMPDLEKAFEATLI